MSESCPILKSLEEQISPKKVKLQKKWFAKHIESHIMWNNAVLCGTDQSHVGQKNLMGNITVSCGPVGHSSPMWDRAV